MYFIDISSLMTFHAHFIHIYAQHTYIFHDIHIMTISKQFIILMTVICEHKAQTIHQYISLFFKNYKYIHFAYQFLGCIVPMKKSHDNKLKTILYLVITHIRNRTHMMQPVTFCRSKNIENAVCVLYYIYIHILLAQLCM